MTDESRAALKARSRERVLVAAARRLRAEGLEGAAIGPVMRDAGLTHGAFYAHFESKEALAEAAFAHAFLRRRPEWLGGPPDRSWKARLRRLARGYLNRAHRDGRAEGCAFSALAADAARAPDGFRETFARELNRSLDAMTGEVADPVRRDEAIAALSLFVGGLSLSRAVADPQLSDRILRACREAAERIAAEAQTPPEA